MSSSKRVLYHIKNLYYKNILPEVTKYMFVNQQNASENSPQFFTFYFSLGIKGSNKLYFLDFGLVLKRNLKVSLSFK